MRKPALALPLACLLTGCNLAPAYRPPVVEMPPRYAAPPAAAEVVATLGWQAFFTDAQLRFLIGRALERNRDLAQAVARVEQAHAQYRIRDAARLPELDLAAGASHVRTPLQGLPSAAGAAGGGAISYDLRNLGVTMPAFELDFWGRVRNLSDAARARYLASVEAERSFRLSIIGQLAETYYAIRAGEERIALAQRAVASRREGERLARMRLDAGLTSSIDFDQATSLATQAESELAEQERTVEQLRNLLMVLVGGPVDTPLPPADSIAESRRTRPLDAGLPSTLLAARPDIVAAEMRLRAANADIGAARAAFFPTFSLTGSQGWTSAALGDLVTSGARTTSIGAALDLPLLDWGRRKADLAGAKARAREATAAYQRTVQQAFREVADGLSGRRRYAEQIDAQKRAVEAQRRLARTARLRYANGIAIYLEVLDAERNLFTAEQQLLALQMAELRNDVSLYIALGGDTAK